jgi:hypothetical protein
MIFLYYILIIGIKNLINIIKYLIKYIIKYIIIMQIVINSNKNFTKALDKLLSSLENCKEYNDYNIIVCIGGYYELNNNYEILKLKDNLMYIKVSHNSIDFTGLITVLENEKLFDNYFFYLHDTCVVGTNFLKILKEVSLENITTYKIKLRSSMNIGIYSLPIIKKNSDFLLKQKNLDKSNEMTKKKSGVSLEDYIFKNDNNVKVLNNPSGEHISRSKPIDYYNTGTMRVIDYYDGIDLYKIKANWKSNNLTLNN